MIKCVYPGSFDPVTSGHLDIIERAAAMFDDVTVAVLVNKNKKPAFSAQQRMDFIKRSTTHLKGIQVDSFHGLLVDYMKKRDAQLIIRGLRAISDFEYEFQMAAMNAKLAKDVETVFLMTDISHSFLSSSMVKEIVSHGGDITGLVPEDIKNDVIKYFCR
ncbi:MAG: pantetheine-phosphate adenylyltransferase [Eubacteriales bacterium]|nr:pantetheine-phosphate adenylyltransferase [Eubacteriales bacterium]